MKGVVPLQKSLYSLARRRMAQDVDYGKFRGKTSDCLNRDNFQRYRLFQLKRTLDYVYEKSPFYRELFDRHKLKPNDINSLGDLYKLPLTNPEDINENPLNFLCISQSKIARIITFTSSGTVGPKKRIFFSKKDIDMMTDFMAAGINAVTGEKGVVQILLPKGPVMGQSDLLARGVNKMRAEQVVMDMKESSDRQIEAIKAHGTKVLFGETRLINRITIEAQKKYDLKNLGLEIAFLTTSYVSDPLKERIKSAWDCDVYIHYGLTEMGLGVAIDCPAHEGYHYNELDLIAEVIDPETGEVLPEDWEGELVFTTISREAMPLIRYRTHDVSTLMAKPCKCGASLERLGQVKRRLESTYMVGGKDQVYLSMFDDVLYKIPEIIDYGLSLDKTGGKDTLSFKIEATEISEHLYNHIRQSLLKIKIISYNVLNGKMNYPIIEILPFGSLRNETLWAKKMIKDLRDK
jgi:phenylacetate-CoA ligase